MVCEMTEGFETLPGGMTLFVKRFSAGGPRAGVLLVAHGLGETADYYDEFARGAAEAGFDLIVPELRGHGRTAGDVTASGYANLGGHPGPDSLRGMAGDLRTLAAREKKSHPGAPLLLLGHSMGSVAAQLAVTGEGGLFDALILTGVPFFRDLPALIETARREVAGRGPEAVCRETFQAMFGGLNRPFEPVKTPLDWITTDEESIRWSLSQPYTAVLFSAGFYYDFLLAVKQTQDAARWKSVRRDLPFLLMCGGDDVMSLRGEGIGEKRRMLVSLGFSDVTCRVFPGLRHSILREKNRGEVAHALLRWAIARAADGGPAL